MNMRLIALLSLLLVAAVSAEVIEYVTLWTDNQDEKITVHKLSTSESEDIEVSGLDFSHMKGFNLNTFKEQRDGNIIVMGYFAPNGDLPNPRFVVLQEFIALFNPNPHTLAYELQNYYTITVRDPPIECFVAPCNNLLAWNIRTGDVTEFTALDTKSAVGEAVDETWLNSRIFSRPEFSAIVLGSFRDGKSEPGGVEKVLEAEEIFIHFPDRDHRCPEVAQVRCVEGQEPAFKRDENRCLEAAGCVDSDVMCIQMIPECSEGYTLVSFRSVTGCPQYYCDPSFL